MIKLSIVTINLNNSVGLEKTIKSVAAQTYAGIEYIVIDGNSTDSSISVIESLSAHISYWVSEKDSGLYDAMNKGLKQASGEYVFFLNSADTLWSPTTIGELLNQANGEDIIYGNISCKVGNKIKELKSNPFIQFYKQYQHDLPPHPAMLIKRNLINSFGGFDTNYKIIADVVVIAKMFSYPSTTYKYVDANVTCFDMMGVSSSKQNQQSIYLERKRFITECFPQFLASFERIYAKSNKLKRVLHKIKNLRG